MDLLTIKKLLSEYGNVAVAKDTLENLEIIRFLNEIGAKIEQGFGKRGTIVKITGSYELTNKDFEPTRRKAKTPEQMRAEYLKIVGDMEKRQQEVIKNGQ